MENTAEMKRAVEYLDRTPKFAKKNSLDTIREYLGQFASLRSNNDINSHICQIHNEYTAMNGTDNVSLEQQAYDLTIQAYQLAGASPGLSNDQRRQINTAISAVQTLLSIQPVDTGSLQAATDNLRNQLSAAGLL